MAESVLKATLEMNGVNFEDFSSITPGGYTKSKQVNLMGKTNTAKTTPRYSVQVNVVVPAVDFPIDPLSIENGTLTYQYDSGQRFSYGGVYTGEIGEGGIDGETEYNYSITYNCETFTKE